MEIIGTIWWNRKLVDRSSILWSKYIKPIRLYRNDIQEGQVFIAHIDTNEGHDRVTLIPDNDYFARQDNPEHFDHDVLVCQVCKKLENLKRHVNINKKGLFC